MSFPYGGPVSDGTALAAPPRQVLLVEDNRGDARLVEAYLEAEQEFTVMNVRTLDEALRETEATRFDVVLVDLGLPDSFGLETFRRVYDAVGSVAPVVILSGTSDEALATAAVSSGAEDYLRKDELTATVLTRTLRYAIERHRLRRQLEKVDRLASIGRLAATMAHEFNNVLMAIAPWATTVSVAAAGDQRLQSAAAHILESVRRGKGITFQILDYVRPCEPRKDVFALAGWLADMADEMKPTLRSATELILEDLPPNEVFVAADQGQLAQVLSNLVRNADEATDQPAPVRLALRTRAGDAIDIVVTDQGAGVPLADRERIFEPLYSTKRTGTGLGLTVAFQIAKAHGGTLTVESAEPRGARFVLTLPTVRAHVPAADSGTAAPAWIRRVLIVDDEEVAAEGVKQLLLLDVAQVAIAHTGSEALELMPSFRPDLVILDVGLPDMNGVDVMRRMAAPRPMVVFATGHVQRGEAEQFLGRNVAHVTKPYALEDIWMAVRALSDN